MRPTIDQVEVAPTELAGWLDDPGRDIVVVDLRAPGEVERWRVEGAREVPRIERPYWDVLGTPELLEPEIAEGAGAVVICAHGSTSALVAEELRGIGVPAVNLQGGMLRWGQSHVARTVPGMPEGTYLVQLERLGKGCLSYVAGIRGGPAMIVDPDRFDEAYLHAVGAHRSRVESVVDTHLHADHISGGASLADVTGAAYFLADDAGASVDHIHAGNGDLLLAGPVSAQAVALDAPGHTPGSMGILVAGRFLLSGDTLFVRGVGRPDLGGQADAWGRELHRTLTERLAHLPDDVVVLPAHFQERTEARPDGIFAATLGELRAHAEFNEGVDEFLHDVIGQARPAPAEYAQIRKVNLGIEHLATDRLDELETGKNQCAAGGAIAA